MINRSMSPGRPATAFAAVFATLVSACAHRVDPPDAQLVEARASIRQAESDDARNTASVDLAAAQDKLRRAEAAARSKDFETARDLAEEARADADLADHKTRAVKAQLAAQELAQSNAILRQELDRKARP